MSTSHIILGLCVVVVLVIILYAGRTFFQKEKHVVPKKTNRRTAFRLSLLDQDCWFYPASSGEPEYKGLIRDISITGMKLHSLVDIGKIDEITVEFAFLQESFTLTGQIRRRKILENDFYEYGVHFHPLDEKTEQKLFKVLWEKSKEKIVI
ncbi:PilZ domain-containing protein [Neobacillus sp. SAB-20_R2A]|uniref:PilZ domain-containing protein n=1 Tax=Neobacillus sp. SAB-20_R2A TaxID=3120519 RepID=UPI003C6DEFA3